MQPGFVDHIHHIQQFLKAALDASEPAMAVRRHLALTDNRLAAGSYTYDLTRGRVILIAVGKASVPMGRAVIDLLGDQLSAGLMVTKKKEDQVQEIEGRQASMFPENVRLLQGGHPVSDEDSILAATAIAELLSDTTAEDLVLCLISGGASAILADPRIPLAEWQILNRELLASGCSINELNIVRRQLDRIKGGGLARLAAPANCLSLILSDVVGNPLEVIGSGPTVLHTDTATETLAILERYQIASRLSDKSWNRISAAIERPDDGALPEPATLEHVIVGDVRQAAEAALIKAAQLGFMAEILTTKLEGEAREVARVAAAIAKDMGPGRCLIMGGETTVTIRGEGRGGRNQELVLAAAIELAGWPNKAIASFATDGEDGPTGGAGAIVTGDTIAMSLGHGLDPVLALARNDSYTFFTELDAMVASETEIGSNHIVHKHLIRTGSTGTNVNDLLFILSYG